MNYQPRHLATEGQATVIICFLMLVTMMVGMGSAAALYIAYVLYTALQHLP